MMTYATLLSSNNYLEGVLTLKHSLDLTATEFPFLVLVTGEVSDGSRTLLERAGCRVRPVDGDFPLPREVIQNIPVDRWRKCFDKLRFFGMTEYDKIVYLDADMLVVRNIDHLFTYPHLSAVTPYGGLRGYEQWRFPNAGFWVIEPQTGLDEAIFAHWPALYARSGNVNDQTLIYAHYREKWEKTTDWQLPVVYNCFVYLIDRLVREKNLNLRLDDPDECTIAILHFVTRFRPWLMNGRAQMAYLIRKLIQGKFTEVRVFFLYRKLLKQVRNK